MPPPQNVWVFVGAAVVGIISAASVFLIENYVVNRRQNAMAHELHDLGDQVTVMRKQLQKLEQEKKESKERKNKRHNTSRVPSLVDEYTTATDIDSSDMEFYDLSDEDDTTLISRSSVSDKSLKFKEIDIMLDSVDESILQSVMDRLEEISVNDPENVDVLWRLGKCYHTIAKKAALKVREELINKGLKVLEKALDINFNIPENHKWYAILIGSRAEFQPLKNRILDGFTFRKHVDIALELSPMDASLHHLLGRFAFEVASLTWIERKTATALFSEPPSATYEEALQHLLKSETLTKESWKENKLFLAKCYINMGELKEAIYWLDKADELETNEDESIDLEIKKLKEKYSSHR